MMEWARRRKRGLAVAAGLAGVAYGGYQFAKTKFNQMQARMMQTQADQEQLRARWTQVLENACLTTLALLAPLLPRVSARFDVDALTEQLQQRRSSPHESQTSSQLLASSTHADASTDMAASQAPSSASDSKVLVDPTASMQSNKSEDVESSTSRDVRSKADIWSDIKLLSFAKSLTSLYVATLVACLTHLQLAILAKHQYIASLRQVSLDQVKESSDRTSMTSMLFGGAPETSSPAHQASDERISSDVELQFLAMSWWVLNRGCDSIGERVSSAVTAVFSKMDLKASITPADLQACFFKVRHLVEGSQATSSSNFRDALLPMTPDEELVLFDESKVPMSTQSSAALQLRGLLDELADALDAPDFQLVLKACLDKIFGQLSMSLDSAFISPSSSADSSDPSAATTSTITETPDRCVRLVKLLPRVAREASNIVNANPNEYIESLCSVQELKAFSAVLLATQDP